MHAIITCFMRMIYNGLMIIWFVQGFNRLSELSEKLMDTTREEVSTLQLLQDYLLWRFITSQSAR